MAIIQVRNGDGLDQKDNNEVGEKLSDSKFILEV